MKILFIIPNFNSYVIAPPLGVLYLSSYIKKYCNAETKIIDALRDNLSTTDILKISEEYNPDIIGIHCLTAFYKQAIDISLALKKKILKHTLVVFIPHLCHIQH